MGIGVSGGGNTAECHVTVREQRLGGTDSVAWLGSGQQTVMSDRC